MRIALACILALVVTPGAPKVFDLSTETVGAEPKTITPVVGVWTIAQDGNSKVLLAAGSRWKEGQPAANIADTARALYGDRYAQFLDNAKSFAYYPSAVATRIDDCRAG